MTKKVIIASCSTLILGFALSSTTYAAPSSYQTAKPHYVEADNNVNSAVPKLTAPDMTATPAGKAPYRLSHLAGLGKTSRIKINGFMSAGVAHINSGKNYQIPDHGRVGDTYNFNALSLLGLQISAKVYKGLTVVAQLVANGDDTNGNTAYSVNLDYGYARYAFNNNYAIRAGRFRLPAFMFSATQEIGYTFPWVTLPNEVYRIVPFNNINGFDAIAKHALGNSGWNVSFEPYIGSSTSNFDLYTTALGSDATAVPTAKFSEDSMVGAVGTLGNKYVSLRATYVHLKLTGRVDIGGVNTQIVNKQTDNFYSLGGKLNYKGFMFAGEFAHRNTPAPLAELSGMYAMLGYKLYDFLPNFTYGRMWTTNTSALVTANPATNQNEMPQKQESFTGGLDYYWNSNVVFKGSIADVRPMGGTRGLFDTVQPALLKKNNWLYMVGVDAIF